MTHRSPNFSRSTHKRPSNPSPAPAVALTISPTLVASPEVEAKVTLSLDDGGQAFAKFSVVDMGGALAKVALEPPANGEDVPPVALTKDALWNDQQSIVSPIAVRAGPLPPPLSDDLARRVREWDFNLHDIPAVELPALCFGVLTSHAELEQLNVDKARLWRFVQEIASRYHANPFHSFRHAVDVTICDNAAQIVRTKHSPWCAYQESHLFVDLDLCVRFSVPAFVAAHRLQLPHADGPGHAQDGTR